ncbi:COG4280 domain-containing protein [Streptomyces sp. NPDC087270]|uniref:COG4280 domain-containing protein n=1 Tax=Streptomyces sp. NPDC087270 TaxID=3365774 RepID=UPI0037FB58EB
MSGLVLVLTVFLACAVEAVEALTIVLAAGTSRNWRSALQGSAAALVTLAIVVAALGPAIGMIPFEALRLVVGALLLVFGLQWLRKAILRASGHKALHDEAGAYAKEVAAADAAAGGGRGIVTDWYAFTLSFKGVFLEGLEVAFIVVTFGNNQGSVPLAALGAAAAVVAVTGVGLAVRAPLARVPENSMKFAVGIMLTAFGVFWSAEGAGVDWPGADAALLVLVPVIALLGLGTAALLRRTDTAVPPAAATTVPPAPAAKGSTQ